MKLKRKQKNVNIESKKMLKFGLTDWIIVWYSNIAVDKTGNREKKVVDKAHCL